MVELILLLIDLGIAVSVENPLNSLYWLTSFMVKLFERLPGHFAALQHCMRGGSRELKSKFWSYNPRQPHVNFIASLGLMRNQSHLHESWKPRWVEGKLFFPTTAEATYTFIYVRGWLSYVWTRPWQETLPLAPSSMINLRWM